MLFIIIENYWIEIISLQCIKPFSSTHCVILRWIFYYHVIEISFRLFQTVLLFNFHLVLIGKAFSTKVFLQLIGKITKCGWGGLQYPSQPKSTTPVLCEWCTDAHFHEGDDCFLQHSTMFVVYGSAKFLWGFSISSVLIVSVLSNVSKKSTSKIYFLSQNTESMIFLTDFWVLNYVAEGEWVWCHWTIL